MFRAARHAASVGKSINSRLHVDLRRSRSGTGEVLAFVRSDGNPVPARIPLALRRS
jgi:hypothetical protein